MAEHAVDVVTIGKELWAGGRVLSEWLHRTDFRGFRYEYPGGKEIRSSVLGLFALPVSYAGGDFYGDDFMVDTVDESPNHRALLMMPTHVYLETEEPA